MTLLCRSGRVDIAHNDVNLLENVWLANYDIYPATVLVGFRFERNHLLSRYFASEK